MAEIRDEKAPHKIHASSGIPAGTPCTRVHTQTYGNPRIAIIDLRKLQYQLNIVPLCLNAGEEAALRPFVQRGRNLRVLSPKSRRLTKRPVREKYGKEMTYLSFYENLFYL
jgi:hypothetical protein